MTGTPDRLTRMLRHSAILTCLMVLLPIAARAQSVAQPAKHPSSVLADIQGKLLLARRSLESPMGATLDAEQRQRLFSALIDAEAAVTRYTQLSQQGDARQIAMAPLAVAGAGVVADDATGVGVGDDVLLPFIGIAMLAAYCKTASPASNKELAIAWQEVIGRLDALTRITDQIRAARWTCTAQCNVQAIPGKSLPTFPERVFGTGSGTSEAAACENAKRSATQSAPAGTYPRHCKCTCGKS